MLNKVLIYGRLLIALGVIVLCGLAFWNKLYPVKIFDLQFVSALQSGLIFDSFVSLMFLLALIIITLLFGRIYCSMLCPLGLYQELLTILFKPFYKKRKLQAQKHHTFAYILAAVLFGSMFGGTVSLLRRADPYAIAGNAMSGALFGLGFIAVLTILVFFKRRFFCTNICPVGAILGFISRFSPFKIRIDNDKCRMCSLCALSCPCEAIDASSNTVNNETCIKCFKCLAHCNHGAIYYGLPQKEKINFNPSRRQFIVGVIVAATAYSAHKGSLLWRLLTPKNKIILPAGARNTAEFSNRCLNCNLCVQNCPMEIIKPATADTPFVHLDYGDTYCDFSCNKCSEICPSGAIERITLLQKQNTKIATAVVNENVCIKCGLCAHCCPRKIIIKEDEQFPIISFDKCIGCGACANICPVKAIKIEPLDRQINLS